MDSLEEIFNLQQNLRNRLIASGRYPTTTDARLYGLCTAIIHEAVELQRCTSWKWWKKEVPLDITKAREELIDIWHFLVDASLTLGMDNKTILEEYAKKNATNHLRQDQGY